MEWWQIILFLLGIYFAYSAGHWVGYGKGEQDTRELTEEIRKLNKKRTRYLRWSSKPQSHKVKNFRKTLNSKLELKPKNHRWEPVNYKTPHKQLAVKQPVYVKSFEED